MGQAGLCPGACRKALVACVQATGLYGAELWWDDRQGAGVKNRRDEIQKLENQLGRAVTGNLRTTNLGVVIAELGLRPAECLLNNRSRHHAIRLMSLPHGTTHSPLQRLLWTGGRDNPTGGGTNGARRGDHGRRGGVGRAEGKKGERPAGAHTLDGRVAGWKWRNGISGGVEEGEDVGHPVACPDIGYFYSSNLRTAASSVFGWLLSGVPTEDCYLGYLDVLLSCGDNSGLELLQRRINGKMW